MALSMTSFHNNLFLTTRGKITLPQAEPDAEPGSVAEVPADTVATGTAAEAEAPAPARSEQPAVAPQAEAPEVPAQTRESERISLDDAVARITTVLGEINEENKPFTVDLDDRGDEDDTVLTDIVVERSERARGRSLRRRSDDKIILTMTTRTDGDLEASMDCDCSNEQTIQIAFTAAELGVESVNNIDDDKIEELLGTKENEIVSKIKEARNSENLANQEEAEQVAQRERAERDCSSRDSQREQLECYIARVKDDEASEGERDEALSEIEDKMRKLVYSDKSADERLFARMLSRLRGHDDLKDLKENLERHQDIRAENNEFKEHERQLHAGLETAQQQYLMYDGQIGHFERLESINGFLTPYEQQLYNQALANQGRTLGMLENAQQSLQLSRSAFYTRVNDIIATSRSHGLFDRTDIQLARNYVSPNPSSRLAFNPIRSTGLIGRARRTPLADLGLHGNRVDPTLAGTIGLRNSMSSGRLQNNFGWSRSGRSQGYLGGRRMGQHRRQPLFRYNDQYPARWTPTLLERTSVPYMRGRGSGNFVRATRGSGRRTL